MGQYREGGLLAKEHMRQVQLTLKLHLLGRLLGEFYLSLIPASCCWQLYSDVLLQVHNLRSFSFLVPALLCAGKLELFYTEGTPELLAARRSIAEYSLPRAALRLQAAKRRREDPDEDEGAEAAAVIQAVTDSLAMDCSEIGDDRPHSGCAFSPDASLLATSGWSGNARLWRVPGIKSLAILKVCMRSSSGILPCLFSLRKQHCDH